MWHKNLRFSGKNSFLIIVYRVIEIYYLHDTANIRRRNTVRNYILSEFCHPHPDHRCKTSWDTVLICSDNIFVSLSSMFHSSTGDLHNHGRDLYSDLILLLFLWAFVSRTRLNLEIYFLSSVVESVSVV